MSQTDKDNKTKNHLTPLKSYQKTFCKNCENHCNPAEPRFLACILAAFLDLQAQLTRIQIERR